MSPPPPDETLTLPHPAPVRGLAPGTVIGGKYRLVAPIGAGGMGEVWLAADTGPLGRSCAVKFLAGSAPAARRRFEAEAKIMDALRHPHIVPVTDLGIDAGTGLAYYVMDEFLPTPEETLRICRDILHCPPPAPQPGAAPLSLARLLDGGKTLPEEAVLSVARQLLSAIEAAHELEPPAIHRDIKPSNILFASDGRALLADFGIAKRLAAPESLPGNAPPATPYDSMSTLPGATPGTPAYAAPEQLEGKTVTPAADFYSFGLVLFRALTGGMPDSSPLLPSDIAPAVARAWRELFRGLLEKDPAARLAQPARIRAIFDEIGETLRRRQRTRRRRMAWNATGAAIVLAGIAFFLVFARRRPDVQERADVPESPASVQETSALPPGDLPIQEASGPAVPKVRAPVETPVPPEGVATKEWVSQYAENIRRQVENAIVPEPDDRGIVVVSEGQVLLSGDLDRTGRPSTVLLDGGTLLFAPFGAALDALLFDQVDFYLENAPEGSRPPSGIPLRVNDHLSNTFLVGPAGGRFAPLDGAVTSVTVTGGIRPADGLDSATLRVSGGEGLILDRAAIDPRIHLAGSATLADIGPDGPIRNRSPFTSP